MAYLSSKLAFLALLALAAAALGAAQNSPQDFVRQHNMARAAVGVGPVHWDNNVAAYARRYAARRQRDCMQVHSSNGPYGENIFVGSARRAWSASDVVDMWMAEKRYYRYGNNSCSAPAGKSCGHYTQMMWRASTAIGCAHVVCDNNGGVFIVCSYSPRGNHRGRRPY